MDVGHGSSLRVLRWVVCVCVIAFVFASNVTMVKARPLLVRRSLKNQSLENYYRFEGN
jgi:ABC-type uncharacterized transport system fused permease/ATPase subunit